MRTPRKIQGEDLSAWCIAADSLTFVCIRGPDDNREDGKQSSQEVASSTEMYQQRGPVKHERQAASAFQRSYTRIQGWKGHIFDDAEK